MKAPLQKIEFDKEAAYLRQRRQEDLIHAVHILETYVGSRIQPIDVPLGLRILCNNFFNFICEIPQG